MPNTRDARARRTAEALQRALLDLLAEKSLDQITVREIAAKAGVNYATFFRHHAGKEALLDSVASEEIKRLVALSLPIFDAENMAAANRALFQYVDENRTLWRSLLTGGAAGLMREEQLRISREVAKNRLQSIEGSWLPTELAVSCSASLLFETLVWWLDQPKEECSIERGVEILTGLIGRRGVLPCEPDTAR